MPAETLTPLDESIIIEPEETPDESVEPVIEEENLTFEQKALRDINALVDRDNLRAKDRYKGAFKIEVLGRINRWFNRAGERKIAETLEETGQYNQAPKWRKWAGIGLKIAGGLGVVTAMVATGGAAALTPILYSEGLQTAIDGTLQVGEELGWGRKRTRAENQSQEAMTVAIEVFKSEIGREDLTEEEYAQAVVALKQVEIELMSQQFENIQSEKKFNLGRKIISGVATLATGVFNGIPLGHEAGKVATKVGAVSLDHGHRTFWNIFDGKIFSYNSVSEYARVSTEAAKLQAAGFNYPLTLVANKVFHQAGHLMGQGLNWENLLALGGALGLMAGKIAGAAKKNTAGGGEGWRVPPIQGESLELDQPEESEIIDNRSEPLLAPPVVSAEGRVSLTPEIDSYAVASDFVPVDRADFAPWGVPVTPLVAEPAVLPQTPERPRISENPREILDSLRDQIKEKQKLFDFFARRSLEKRFEGLATSIFNHILEAQGGLAGDGLPPSSVRNEFCKQTGLDPAQFSMMKDSKKQMSIKIKWGMIS